MHLVVRALALLALLDDEISGERSAHDHEKGADTNDNVDPVREGKRRRE